MCMQLWRFFCAAVAFHEVAQDAEVEVGLVSVHIREQRK
jgi:hypothetical protein